MAQKVLVTGASGFIAAHIIKQLFDQGYFVVGTVRADSKGEFFVKKHPLFQYEIVPDISVNGAFDHVFKAHPDIKYVIHPASPFRYDTSNAEKDLIQPAIKGTESLLQAAFKFGPDVKKIVVTSSFASMWHYPLDLTDHSVVYTEKDWNTIARDEVKDDMHLGYLASKLYAEKAAWDFLESKKPNFTITTVQVPYVFGPPINDIGIKNLNTSNEIIWNLIHPPRGTTEIPNNALYYIDVRDAAETHIIAMTNDGLDNKRCFSVAGISNEQLILDTLRKIRPELKDKLLVGNPGSFSVKNFAQFDNSETLRLLNIKYLTFEQMIGETVDRLEELADQEKA